MSRVLYIVGPTASGKTDLAISLAKRYNGEIICADSRTIYRGLDIGTAKPNEQERSSIKHYGLDLVAPSETFSAAKFAEKAKGWIKEIEDKGKLPIIVGGTGLYIDSLFYNYTFVEKADDKIRGDLDKLSLDELQKIIDDKGYEMPENYKNKRYLIRAIERAGEIGSKSSPDAESMIIGLYPGKDILEARIKNRSELMLGLGVEKECRWLFQHYGFDCPGANGNIYRALAPYFKNESELQDCIEKFKVLDRRLAKRQMTWFKRNENIKWFENGVEAEKYIGSIL